MKRNFPHSIFSEMGSQKIEPQIFSEPLYPSKPFPGSFHRFYPVFPLNALIISTIHKIKGSRKVTFSKLYVTFSKLCVTFRKLYVTFSKLYVAFCKLYVTFSKLYVAFSKLYAASSKLCVTFRELYATSSKLCATFRELYAASSKLCMRFRKLIPVLREPFDPIFVQNSGDLPLNIFSHKLIY